MGYGNLRDFMWDKCGIVYLIFMCEKTFHINVGLMWDLRSHIDVGVMWDLGKNRVKKIILNFMLYELGIGMCVKMWDKCGIFTRPHHFERTNSVSIDV